jgi:hypothetical protein
VQLRSLLAPLLALALVACESTPPYDYAAFHAHAPRSILVLPPLDNTMDVSATYAYLATVTRPLAERGYYVFPVAVVDRMLRDNGLPGPAEMQSVSLAKLGEVFGADAVLYVTLENWGTAFHVIDSSTSVSVQAHLVDVATGTEIWRGKNTATYSSSSNSGGGLFGMLAGAITNQIMTSIEDPSQDVARQCNDGLYCNSYSGLLYGPYSENYGKDL